MNLFLAIGVTMLILGITMFGAMLYVRRRTIMKKRADSITHLTTQESYSHIDLDDDILVKRLSLNARDNSLTDVDKISRIIKLKKIIIGNKNELKLLSADRVKYNKLIVENDIITHGIEGNAIVYTSRVIEQYPELHRYLIDLHGIRNKIRNHWDELNTLVTADEITDISIYRSLIAKYTKELITNTYDLKINRYNKMQSSIKYPTYHKNVGLDNDVLFSLNKAGVKKYLFKKSVSLRKEKVELEKKVSSFRIMKELLETLRLD